MKNFVWKSHIFPKNSDFCYVSGELRVDKVGRVFKCKAIFCAYLIVFYFDFKNSNSCFFYFW